MESKHIIYTQRSLVFYSNGVTAGFRYFEKILSAWITSVLRQLCKRQHSPPTINIKIMYAGSLHFEYISSAGIGGHMCIKYPQCTGTGKEHFVRQHKMLLAVLPTENLERRWRLNCFKQWHNLVFELMNFITAYNLYMST